MQLFATNPCEYAPSGARIHCHVLYYIFQKKTTFVTSGLLSSKSGQNFSILQELHYVAPNSHPLE